MWHFKLPLRILATINRGSQDRSMDLTVDCITEWKGEIILHQCRVIWVAQGVSFVTRHHPLRTRERLESCYHFLLMIGKIIMQCEIKFYDSAVVVTIIYNICIIFSMCACIIETKDCVEDMTRIRVSFKLVCLHNIS